MCARACNRQHCIETTAGIERGCGCMRGRRTRFVPPPRSFSVRILEPRLFFLFFYSQHVDRIEYTYINGTTEVLRYIGIRVVPEEVFNNLTVAAGRRHS